MKCIYIFIGVSVVIFISVIYLLIYLCRPRHNPITPLTEQQSREIYKGKDIALPSLCTQNTKRCEKPAGSHRCCIDHLATMLEALTDQLGPKIFILFGTALACKRYNGKYMIPHGDDLDTGILAEDEELLKEAIPKLEKKGFTFHLAKGSKNGEGPDPSCSDSKNCPQIKYPPYRYYEMNYSKTNNLHLNIALLTSSKLKNGLQVLVDAPQKWANLIPTMSMEETAKYKTWIFPRNFILPVKLTTYLDMNVYCPNNIDNYLKYVYSPNYMIPYDRDKNGGNKEPVGRLINNIEGNNKDIGIGPILIINLDEDVERLHHFLTQCKEENLYAKRIGNCCSEELTKKDKDRFKYNNKLRANLMSGEMKCFLSHEMCWVEAAKQNIPSLIVEDDISFPFNVKPILARIIKDLNTLIDARIIPLATTIRLGMSSYAKHSAGISQLKNTCLATANFHTGTWAYIITPEAAKILLKTSNMNKISWPVDHFVNPPYNRDSHKDYETRIPDNNKYICLEVFKDIFEPINQRYILNIDKKRYQIIQELSTEFKTSRSAIKEL